MQDLDEPIKDELTPRERSERIEAEAAERERVAEERAAAKEASLEKVAEPKATRETTGKYIVLVSDAANTWKVILDGHDEPVLFEGGHAAAKRAALNGDKTMAALAAKGEVELSAVPAGSWRPSRPRPRPVPAWVV